MILDQGESAFIIEFNGQEGKFTGYTQPRKGKIFEEGEIRNAYLAQNISDKKFEDQGKEILINYLEENTWNLSKNQQQLEKYAETIRVCSVAIIIIDYDY